MRPVTLRARGHPAVRALHPKTIELTTDATLTERGTCIVGVAARLDPGSLGQLRGPVTVTLEARGQRDVVHGTANPAFDAHAGRAVIRRSRHRAPDTLVYRADKGAADLDRALVAALQDGGADLRVTIEPAADIASTHATVAFDLPLDDTVAAAVREADEVHVDVSSPPRLAVAAVLAGAAGPVTLAGALPRRASGRRAALAAGPEATTVWDVAPADVARVAAEAGDRLVAVVLDAGTADERVIRTAPERSPRARHAAVVVAPGGPATRDDAALLLAALLRAGVAPRTLQDAVVDAYGIPRREAYARILAAKP